MNLGWLVWDDTEDYDNGLPGELHTIEPHHASVKIPIVYAAVTTGPFSL